MFYITSPATQSSPYATFGGKSRGKKQLTLPKNPLALVSFYQNGLEREKLALRYAQKGYLTKKEQQQWQQITGVGFPVESIQPYADAFEQRFDFNQIATLRSLAPSQVDGLRGIFSLILEPQGRKQRALLEKTFIRVLKKTDPKRNSALKEEVTLQETLQNSLREAGFDELQALKLSSNVYNTMRELKTLLGERIVNLFIALAPTEFLKKPWKPFTG